MHSPYIFTSARLGFRLWTDADVEPMAAINADPLVMEYFPTVQSKDDTAAFIARMQQLMANKGYCYYAADTLHDGKLIGFIGLADKTFEAPFTPCVDIGWRLSREVWNRGYATEGAARCLQYGFNTLGLTRILSMAPAANKKSAYIMQKIGMTKCAEFIHPQLLDDERLKLCVLYEAVATGR